MYTAVIEIMIESHAALEQLEEILAVPGVDMVHFGPSDYSLSVGKPGQSKSPEIQKQNLYVIETALNMGVRPRVVIDGFEEAREYAEIGVRDFCIGSDLGTLYRWCLLNGGKVREMFDA